MDKELKTLKDIAQLLVLPESTLRKYRDAYPQFIPYVGSGRERRYPEAAVEVFRAIRDCRMDRHLSWEDTERDMVGRFPVNADAIGKKAVVGEDEANIFLEKVEKAVRQITSQGERQEFVTSTLVNELLQMKKLIEKLAPMQDDLQAMRKATYSYNEVVQRQYKENLKHVMQIMEALAGMQGALHYIPKEITKAFGAAARPAEPSQPVRTAILPEPPAGEKESQFMARLREELREKEAEIEKFRDLYVRAKREIDRLREELKKKALEEMYGQKKSGAADPKALLSPPPIQDSDAGRGGKLFFRSKKKKPDDF